MIDWVVVGGLGTLGVALLGIVGKYFIDKGILVTEVQSLKDNSLDKGEIEYRLSVLEKQEERIWKMDFLTESSHEKQAHSCREEIYKDMTRLEDNMKGLIDRLVTLEEKREEKDAKLEERLRDLHDAIVDIKSFLKRESDTTKIGVY